jgi:hypothetical protein
MQGSYSWERRCGFMQGRQKGGNEHGGMLKSPIGLSITGANIMNL